MFFCSVKCVGFLKGMEYIHHRNLKEIKWVPYIKVEQKLVDTPYFIPNSVSRIWLHEYKFSKN